MEHMPALMNSSSNNLPRRTFIKGMLAGTGALAANGGAAWAVSLPEIGSGERPAYRGPNMIIVRFGGGGA